ncbi:TPA: hypothetical protein ACH3X1_000623 [Trebouxia sp. C0004]
MVNKQAVAWVSEACREVAKWVNIINIMVACKVEACRHAWWWHEWSPGMGGGMGGGGMSGGGIGGGGGGMSGPSGMGGGCVVTLQLFVCYQTLFPFWS